MAFRSAAHAHPDGLQGQAAYTVTPAWCAAEVGFGDFGRATL
jgi:hypothetical protein